LIFFCFFSSIKGRKEGKGRKEETTPPKKDQADQ